MNIALQTRNRWDIPNAQVQELSSFEEQTWVTLKYKYKPPAVVFRSEPSPVYNCHGMTFASRRTGIYENEVIRKIIDDDKYVRVDRNDVLPGDMILYVSTEGDIEHSGFVITKLDPQLDVPKVWSKWGKFSEAIHWANQCPYSFQNPEYYRIVR